MNIKFFRHAGDQCPAGLRFDDIISAYLADGKWWIGSATALDWTAGAADSPLCWARGMVYKTWAAPMVADTLVKLTNAAEPVAARPDADGWIEWRGGWCPVPAGTLVDVRYRDGVENFHVKANASPSCGSLPWLANYWGEGTNIVAYRLHKPVADADGWIQWNGGDKPPLPGDHLVDFRNKLGMSFEHREVADIDWQTVSAYRPLAASSAVDGPAYDPASVAFKRTPLDADATVQWYLSGPMSGVAGLNFPVFHAAAKALRDLGLQIVNPAEQTVVPDGSSWADYMRHDIKLLTDCKGVICLPGWQNSEGARLEVHIAERLGMPVLAFEHLPR